MPPTPQSDRFVITWSSAFELGVPEIDAQHRHLLVCVNAFAEALMLGVGEFDALAQLLNHTLAHFDFEEALMHRAAYAGVIAHTEQHSELLASMTRVQARLTQGQYAVDKYRTIDFLRDWFTIHIVRADSDFARHLNARGRAEVPK